MNDTAIDRVGRMMNPPHLGGIIRQSVKARKDGAANARSRLSRGASLRRAHGIRAGQWAAQGCVRRPPCPRARLPQGSRPPHVRHDRAGGQPTDAPHRSADLIRLITFITTAAALPERRSGKTRLKIDANAESHAASVAIRSWWSSRSRQLPRTGTTATLDGLASPRIAQSFASGSSNCAIRHLRQE